MVRLFFVCLFFISAAHAELPDRQLTAPQAAKEISLLSLALETIHPGYGRYTPISEFEKSVAQLEASARDGLSANELYVSMSRLLSEIRCDHTKAEIPSWLEAYRDEQPTYLPLQGKLIDGQFYVWHSGIEGIQRGDELLEINGHPMTDVVADIFPLMVFDGYTEETRSSSFGTSGELKGGALDHFLPLLYGESERFQLSFKKPGGAETEVSAPALTYSDWLGLDPKTTGRYVNFSDPDQVRLTTHTEGVGILNVDTFVNYRTPVEPDKVYRPLMTAAGAAGLHTLILDIRENGGGSEDASIGLLRYLMDQPFRVYREKRVRSIDHGTLVDYLSTWEPSAMQPDPRGFDTLDEGWYRLKPEFTGIESELLIPEPQAFQRRLIVLTSRSNASGATALMTQLRKRANTVFVGEPTGGNPDGTTAGVLFFLKLPHSGITVRIPWFLQVPDIDKQYGGKGLEPDIPVEITIESLVAGEDPVLETALGLAARVF